MTNSKEETRKLMLELTGLGEDGEIPLSRLKNKVISYGPGVSSTQTRGELLRSLGSWLNESFNESQFGVILERQGWVAALTEAHGIMSWEAMGFQNDANGGNPLLEGIRDEVNYGLKPGARGAQKIERIGGGISVIGSTIKYGVATANARNSYLQVDVFASILNPEYKTFEVIKYQYDYGGQRYIKYPLNANDRVVEYLRTGR